MCYTGGMNEKTLSGRTPSNTLVAKITISPSALVAEQIDEHWELPRGLRLTHLVYADGFVSGPFFEGTDSDGKDYVWRGVER